MGETARWNSRSPIPEEICLAIVRRHIALRRFLTAAAAFLHPQLYLRPSESVALRADDVLLPVAGAARYRSVAVVVAPRELEVTTKTKVHDDTVLVEAPASRHAVIF